MKKLIIFIAVVSALNSYGQKTQFGFTGGATIANYKSKSDGNDESGKSKIGFTLGMFANMAVGKNFVIQPGLNWVQKGSKDEVDMGGFTEKYQITTNHIEVPVNFIYKGNGFFIGAGPSFSFGVSGKVKWEAAGFNGEEKIHFGNSDTSDIKPFDMGANVLTGYQFKSGFLIVANYNLGLSNLIPGSGADNGSFKSRYFGIKLGYLLHGKGK